MPKETSFTIIGDPKFSNPAKGIASSPLEGIAALRNVDVESQPGAVKINRLPVKVSGSVVTNQITWKRRDPVSGNILAIDSANQVYISVDSGSTWQVIGTGSVGNGAGAGRGLEIWKGYLISQGGNRLDAFKLASSAGTGTITSVGTAVTGIGTAFTTQTPVGTVISVANQYRLVTAVADNTHLTLSAAFSPDVSGVAFTYNGWTKNILVSDLTGVTSNTFTPIFKSIDGNLYIGYGKYVLKLAELTTFDPSTPGTSFSVNPTAITLADYYIIQAIRDLGQYLMLGTSYSGSASKADIFPYDRTSLTLGIPIQIIENGVQAMYTYNNRLYVIAGTQGKLFVTDTVSASELCQLPNYLLDLYGQVSNVLIFYPDAIAYYKGRLLFGVGNSGLGNAGVWSYNIKTKIIKLEYTVSTGNDGSSNPLYVSSILPFSNRELLISWRDNTSYGIDQLSSSSSYTSYTAYAESPLVKIGEALANKTIGSLEVALTKPLRANQGIRIKWRGDLTSSFTTLATFDFATYGAKQSYNFPAGTLTNLVFLQVRAELTTLSTSPELQSVLIHPGE